MNYGDYNGKRVEVLKKGNNKQGELLLFQYNKYRVGQKRPNTNTKRWRCTQHENQCKAALTTYLDRDELKQICTADHNHAPLTEADIMAMRGKMQLKELASKMKPGLLIDSIQRTLPDEAARHAFVGKLSTRKRQASYYQAKNKPHREPRHTTHNRKRSETDPISMESVEVSRDAVTVVKGSASFTVKVEPLEQTILPLLDYANKHNDINAALELVKVEAIIQEHNREQGKFHFQCHVDLETPGSSERVSGSSQNELTVGSSSQVKESNITDTCSSAQSEHIVVQRTKTKRVRKSVQFYF